MRSGKAVSVAKCSDWSASPKMECRGMLRLVQAHFAASGKPDPGDRSPPFLVNGRTLDVLFRQTLPRGLEIFTQEVEFVAVVLSGGMERHFCGRQSEDEPSVTGIDGCKPQHIAKEDAVRLRILAVYDHVCAGNHDSP
jgi:hypothetical protein